MSNMPYCRFENTNSDLRDCQEALEDLLDNGIGKLSDRELLCAKALVTRCDNIRQLFFDAGLIAEEKDFEEEVAEALDGVNAEAEEVR